MQEMAIKRNYDSGKFEMTKRTDMRLSFLFGILLAESEGDANATI